MKSYNGGNLEEFKEPILHDKKISMTHPSPSHSLRIKSHLI